MYSVEVTVVWGWLGGAAHCVQYRGNCTVWGWLGSTAHCVQYRGNCVQYRAGWVVLLTVYRIGVTVYSVGLAG